MREVGVERPADQPGGVGVLDEPARRRKGAGNADADGAHGPGALFQARHDFDDGGERRLVVTGRSADTQPRPLASTVVEGNSFDLGAAEVDTDPHATTVTDTAAKVKTPRCHQERLGAPI